MSTVYKAVGFALALIFLIMGINHLGAGQALHLLIVKAIRFEYEGNGDAKLVNKDDLAELELKAARLDSVIKNGLDSTSVKMLTQSDSIINAQRKAITGLEGEIKNMVKLGDGETVITIDSLNALANNTASIDTVNEKVVSKSYVAGTTHSFNPTKGNIVAGCWLQVTNYTDQPIELAFAWSNTTINIDTDSTERFLVPDSTNKGFVRKSNREIDSFAIAPNDTAEFDYVEGYYDQATTNGWKTVGILIKDDDNPWNWEFEKEGYNRNVRLKPIDEKYTEVQANYTGVKMDDDVTFIDVPFRVDDGINPGYSEEITFPVFKKDANLFDIF